MLFDKYGRPKNDSLCNVALCVIATGEYRRFLPGLLGSARRFFLPGHEVVSVVFSDVEAHGLTGKGPTHWAMIEAEPWPGPTLHRYHTMLSAHSLTEFDYVFYVDADCMFVGTVGNEILGGLVGVIHQGQANLPRDIRDYEVRPESTARIKSTEGRRYYAGGFQGGRAPDFIKAMQVMRGRITIDSANGITAKWHDESHWNRYLVDHPPDIALPPTYCCSDFDLLPTPKLLALTKGART